nr:immunoglobulin light chain junction region [Macaca mulatta]
CQQYDSAPWSF